jgi:capsular exopolysaccharide synthesis family protein
MTKNPLVPSPSLPLVQGEPVPEGKAAYYTVTAVPVEQESDLRQILSFLRRRFWVLVSVASLSAIGLSAWILTRPPQFQGSFRLLVEPLNDDEAKISQTLDLSTAKTAGMGYSGLDYPSQIEVLQSQRILKPILTKIQARYPELTYVTLSERLKIQHLENTKLLDVIYTSSDPKQIEFVLDQLAQGMIQYSVIERHTNIQQGIEFTHQQIDRQSRSVSQLEQQLETFRQRNYLFQPDEYAKTMSEQLTDLLKQKRENQVQASAAESLYRDLQRQLGLSPAEAVVVSTLSEATTYQSLLTKLRDLESQIALESAKFQGDSPTILSLKEQRGQLLPLLSKEAQRILSKSAIASKGKSAQTLDFQVQGTVGRNLGQQLVDAANQLNVLRAQDQAIAKAESQLKGQIQSFAGVAKAYEQIDRDLKIANDSLNRLLAARENLQLELTRQTVPWQLISEINADNIRDASGIIRKLNLAIVASLILGVAAAWLAEKLDAAYHRVEDLTAELRLTCLGIIPFNSSMPKQALALPGYPRVKPQWLPWLKEPATPAAHYTGVPFMESFYSLYTNLRLMSSDSPLRLLTITSTTPGDGKSTVSLHLALAAAGMGSKVLLVDADLRLPRLHAILGIANVQGLSNALTNDALEVDQLYQPLPQDGNVHLLTAGPQPPDPPRLLASNKMRNLMQHWQNAFDLVIFDTPPLQNFVDGKLLASISDGTVLVVGMGKTERNSLKQVVRDLITTTNAPVLGCVANGIRSAYAPHYDSYQHYYEGRSRHQSDHLC